MKTNLGHIKKFRQTAEKLLGKVKSELLTNVLHVLKNGHEKVKTEQEQLMHNFLVLCVTNIQKCWRGH